VLQWHIAQKSNAYYWHRLIKFYLHLVPIRMTVKICLVSEIDLQNLQSKGNFEFALSFFLRINLAPRILCLYFSSLLGAIYFNVSDSRKGIRDYEVLSYIKNGLEL